MCNKRGLNVQVFWKAIFYALVVGLVGGRFYHIIHHIDYFIASPVEMIAVWQGGLGIWGGIFGGLLGVLLSTRHTKNFLNYADIFAVCAPLAQAVSRWGNYFNKELFGYPTSLPWGMYIPPEFRPGIFKYFDRFHPLFLYESVLNLLLFLLLLLYKFYTHQRVVGINLPQGSSTAMYLMGYSAIRFGLEFLRPEPWKFANLPVASIVSLMVFSVSLVWYFNVKVKSNKR